MEETLLWMTENAHWLWLSVGVVLLAGEMVLPGVYLLWLGLAAAVTGIYAWMAPGLGFEGHGLIFAVLAIISIYIGNRFFYQRSAEIDDAQVNVRTKKLVGQKFMVVEPIKNGRGHVRVGDSRWLAEGPDMPKGAMAHVTAVEGTVLMVEAVED